MLEQKIHEYEQKLKLIQKKGKRSKDCSDENSISMSGYGPKEDKTERIDKSERTDKPTARKTPGPCYRQCLMQNTPQTKFARLMAGAATSTRVI